MILAGIILLSSYQESLLKMKTKIHQNEQLQDSLNGFEKWMEKNNFSIELNTFKSNNSNSRKSCIEESSVQECNNQPANKLIGKLKSYIGSAISNGIKDIIKNIPRTKTNPLGKKVFRKSCNHTMKT